MAGSRLLSPIIVADQKELRELVVEAEGYRDDAEAAEAVATAAAGTATTQAVTSTNQAAIATLQAAAAAASAAAATAVVVSGDVSLVPAAGQLPLAQSDGRISPNWIAGSLRPSQWLENVTGTSGLILEDDTEFKFVPQMSPEYLVFIPATLTTEIQIHRDGNFGAYIQTDKKLRVNYGGSYTTISPLSVSDDWVNIQFSYNDNETSAVTFDTNINGVAFGSQQVVTYSDEFIRSIWASDYGFLHLASMGYGFLTNAATTKLQNWGDAIGALPAVAGAAVTLAQATSTARPLIGRVPVGGRRNLLDVTNLLSSGTWTKQNSTVDFLGGDTWEVINSGASSYGLQRAAVTGVGDTQHTIVAEVERVDGGDTFYFSTRITGQGLSGFLGAEFNLTLGTVITSSGTATITALEGNWFRLTYTYTITTSTYRGWMLYQSGSGTKFRFRKPSMVAGAVAGNYQQVGTTSRDITESGVLDQEYAYFDRADDILAGTIDAITDGEIIIAGRNGVWHDSLTVSAGTWQIGATTYTGGPNSILAMLGDYIFSAVIDGRAFTTAERDALYALAEERGAPGVFSVTGSELVTNGTFDSDISGWTKSSGSGSGTDLLTWDSGKAVATREVSPFTYGTPVSLTAGSYYLLTCDHEYVSGATSNALCVVYQDSAYASGGSLGGASSGQVTTSGTVRGIVSAVSTATAYLQIGISAANGVRKMDNISLKEITLTPWS